METSAPELFVEAAGRRPQVNYFVKKETQEQEEICKIFKYTFL